MTISFDEGRKVEYPFKLLEELELAYAVTIHTVSYTHLTLPTT